MKPEDGLPGSPIICLTGGAVVFELADLQPNWLERPAKYRIFSGFAWAFIASNYSLAFFAYEIAANFKSSGSINGASVFGIVMIMGINGILGIILSGKEIKAKEFGRASLQSLPIFKHTGLFFGVILLLCFILVVGLLDKFSGSYFVGLAAFLGVGLWQILSNKKTKDYTEISYPYQRLRARNLIVILKAILIVFFIMLPLMIPPFIEDVWPVLRNQTNQIILLSIVFFVIGQILSSFLAGTVYGILVTPFIKHFVLRTTVWWEGHAPLRYAAFLDEMAKARILEKDGGQWRFRHQNLQDHLANLETK